MTVYTKQNDKRHYANLAGANFRRNSCKEIIDAVHAEGRELEASQEPFRTSMPAKLNKYNEDKKCEKNVEYADSLAKIMEF